MGGYSGTVGESLESVPSRFSTALSQADSGPCLSRTLDTPRRVSPNDFFCHLTLISPLCYHDCYVVSMVRTIHHRSQGSIPADPYRYPHDGSFGPDTTAIVVIDMQRDCTFSNFQIFSAFLPLNKPRSL